MENKMENEMETTIMGLHTQVLNPKLQNPRMLRGRCRYGGGGPPMNGGGGLGMPGGA